MRAAKNIMIEISHLTKRYGALTAVDDVSFTVQPGQVLGFLGPNGAGKSTTMKMITGFLAPTAGNVKVCGHDVSTAARAAKACMGYLPEGAPSYGEMTVRRFLEFVADIRQLKGSERRTRLDDVITRLSLSGVLEQVIETLSKGFKRRVGLAQALLHNPPVLILDEPTDGLDPNQKHEVRELINDMAADKITIISTHILEEVEAVCNRAIIIAAGKILVDDTPQGLEARSRYHNAVTLKLTSPAALSTAKERIGELPGVANIEVVEKDQSITAFPKPGELILPALSNLATNEKWSVAALHLESGRLDEVFRAVTAAAPSNIASASTANAAPTQEAEATHA